MTTITMADGGELEVGCRSRRPVVDERVAFRRRARAYVEAHDEHDYDRLLDADLAPELLPWAALELRRAVVERHPESAHYHLHPADALVETGELEEAQDTFIGLA